MADQDTRVMVQFPIRVDDSELCCMDVLDQTVLHFMKYGVSGAFLNSDQVRRAVTWLHAKYVEGDS